MNATPEPPGGAGGWSGGETLLLGALILVLVALFVVRVQTRRIDSARLPTQPDLLVLHVDELRADAVPTDTLAADLGLPADELLVFNRAFAQSTDGLRSALSLLRGDLALNLQQRPGPASLPARLAAAGWDTLLLAPPTLVQAAGPDFGLAMTVDRAAMPDALAGARPDSAPLFAFVHVPPAGSPLHGQTTDARELQTRYRGRVSELRGLIAALSQSLLRDRPQILVLMGASGAELGEHPDDPERLHDTRLHVPLLIGLRNGRGLPHDTHDTLVQSADLAPTLLDFVDLRSVDERERDGVAHDGVSLEPLAHGWTIPPVHDHLVFAGPGEVAIRSEAWKLAAAVDEPWRIRRSDVRLHALSEDPGERTDLADGRDLGPRGQALLTALGERLGRPEPTAAR